VTTILYLSVAWLTGISSVRSISGNMTELLVMMNHSQVVTMHVAVSQLSVTDYRHTLVCGFV
jgi:hypothetical protein